MAVFTYTYTGLEVISMPAFSLGAQVEGGPQDSTIHPGDTVKSATPIDDPDFTPA